MSQGVAMHGFLYDLYTAGIPQVYGRYTTGIRQVRRMQLFGWLILMADA
ncbi:MAG: hypothetical protein ABI760_16955 [Ferruginibacter sp.]